MALIALKSFRVGRGPIVNPGDKLPDVTESEKKHYLKRGMAEEQKSTRKSSKEDDK